MGAPKSYLDYRRVLGRPEEDESADVSNEKSQALGLVLQCAITCVALRPY